MIESLKTINSNKSIEMLLDRFDQENIAAADLLKMKTLRFCPIAGLSKKVESPVQNILELLCHSKITKSSKDELLGIERPLIDKITTFVQEDRPIEFCLIAFSPKSHSPIETGMRRLPDLGEMMFLKRLLDIDTTIKRVFSPGVRFTVCFEGFSFVDHFGNSMEEVNDFKQDLQEKINQLDTDKKIVLEDLAQITSNFPEFEGIRLQKEVDIRNNFNNSSGVSSEVETFLPVMRRASVDLSDCDFDDLLAVTKAQRNMGGILTDEQKMLALTIEHKALENAIFYVSFNKARQDLKVMEKTFPDQIYISITSKPGRLAIHPINAGTKTFPHHGVPLLFQDGRAEIISFRDLLSRQEFFSGPKFKRVHLEGDEDSQPFFFQEIRKQHTQDLGRGCYG